MTPPVLPGLCARVRHRALPSRVSSLILLLQRSPLVKILMPEARVINSSGFAEAMKWTVTAVAGLGAFDSVSGATDVIQISPGTGNIVSGVAGNRLSSTFQFSGTTRLAASWTVSGALPSGLVNLNTAGLTTNSIVGIPAQTGDFPVTITGWENSGATGRNASGNFTFRITPPPAPAITSHPTGTATTAGSVVKLSVGHTNGQSFTWKRNGNPLPVAATSIVPLDHPRKWFVPTADPGAAWRTDPAFVDSTWTSASGGIGYDTNSTVDYRPLLASPGGSITANKGFANIRIPFTMTNPSPVSFLKLRYKCDDGFVAWLNGTEIGRVNAPANLLWNSSAASATVDVDVLNNWRELAIPSQHIPLLHQGTNLLAIQLLNSSSSSNDLLLTCELIGGIDAVNSPHLLLPSLGLAETGSYTVSVNNFSVPAGVPSNPAPVHILPAVATNPQEASINAGQSAQLSVSATGSSLTYQWYQGNAGDTSHPLNGATSADFTTPPLNTTTRFWVRVSNPGGSADSTAATVTVLVQPPSITTQPASTTVSYNQSTRLTVTPAGTAPFTCQWYRGTSPDTSSPVDGATTETFDTPPLTATTTYWVRITNPGGSVDSQSATITVIDTIDAWRAAVFTPAQIQDPAISGPAANPDGDGMSNEAEYVFGTQPLVFDLAPQLSILPGSGTGLQLRYRIQTASGPGYANRIRQYSIQASDDPALASSWTTLSGSPVISPGNEATQLIPAPASAHRFYRLQVSLTP